MQKRLFIKNGMIMAACALIIRSLAMMFRVYLSEQIGSEGLGIYQLILTVYAFFALISTSGISITVTRLVSDCLARCENVKAVSVTERILLFSVIFSTALAAVLFSCADILGGVFLRDVRTVPALKLLAPSMPFMSFSAVLRGYFTAQRKMLRTAGEQLLEQVSEIGMCVFVFTFFAPKNLAAACCAAVSGTTAAEVLSFVYSLILYLCDIKRLGKKREPVRKLFRQAAPIALPCTASSGLRSGLAAVENMLIPAGLMKFGADSAQALSEYGMIGGMAMPVIVFPSVFILPFASLVITEMSQANALNHKKSISHIAERMISATLKYSIPVMFIFIFFSDEIGRLIYHSDKAGFYIAALAPVVPLMYLDSSVDGMLKGLNKQTSYLIYNVIDSVIRVILTYFLLPVTGAAGVVFIIIFSELLNTSMSVWGLIRVTKLKIHLFDNIILPAVCILIPCLISTILPDLFGGTADLFLKLFLCLGFYCPTIMICHFSRRGFSAERKAVLF